MFLGCLWGSAFPLIKIAVEVYDPVHVTMLRLFLGAGLLMAWLSWKRPALPRGRRNWAILAVMAGLYTSCPSF